MEWIRTQIGMFLDTGDAMSISIASGFKSHHICYKYNTHKMNKSKCLSMNNSKKCRWDDFCIHVENLWVKYAEKEGERKREGEREESKSNKKCSLDWPGREHEISFVATLLVMLLPTLSIHNFDWSYVTNIK